MCLRLPAPLGGGIGSLEGLTTLLYVLLLSPLLALVLLRTTTLLGVVLRFVLPMAFAWLHYANHRP